MHAEFQTHKLNDQGFAKAKQLAEKFDELLTYIEGTVTSSRERSIAATKLEEACFFAKKALAKEYSEA